MEKVSISNIQVTKRIRREITNIDALAADISKNGLINPITLMKTADNEYRLLAGLRRIKATETLGLDEIAAHVVSPLDAEAALRIEISENEQREAFTYSERMDYARLLEEIEVAKAKERMSTGGAIGGVGGHCKISSDKGVVARPHPCAESSEEMNDKDSTEQRYPQNGKSRDAIGSKIGMSGRTYERAKYIRDNASEETIDKLDKGETSIYKEYNNLRDTQRASEQSSEDDSDDECVLAGANDSATVTGSNGTDNNDSCTTDTDTPPPNPPAKSTPSRPPNPNPNEIDESVPWYKDTKEYRDENGKRLFRTADGRLLESGHPDTLLPAEMGRRKPLMENDNEEERKIREFNALPPLKKIEALKEQLREERGLRGTLRHELTQERAVLHNLRLHSGDTIKNLTWQLEEMTAKARFLADELAKAMARIQELEAQSQ